MAITHEGGMTSAQLEVVWRPSTAMRHIPACDAREVDDRLNPPQGANMSTHSMKGRHHGQGMTEYIIVVALIAIAAVGVYNYFGKTVRSQTSAMAQGLAGDEGKSTKDSKKAGEQANAATNAADAQKGLSNFGQDSGNH